MGDELLWKRRFLIFTGARLFGLAMFLLGLAIAFSDLFREGGLPVVGSIVAVLGVLDAVFAPRMLKKAWQEEDARAGRRGDPPTGSR